MLIWWVKRAKDTYLTHPYESIAYYLELVNRVFENILFFFTKAKRPIELKA